MFFAVDKFKLVCLKKKEKYLKEGRLEDVLALIQVLALDKDSHRSEEGLKLELLAQPNSANSWTQLAKEHQEFFRVAKDKTNSIALVSRHVSENSAVKRPPLSSKHTQALLHAAIELHDRQIRWNQRWTVLVPIWVAVIGGLFLLVGTMLTR